MLTVLSPAKSLDFERPLATRKHSQPALLDRAAELVEIMAAKSPAEIAGLMDISPTLAELNVERFADWEAPFTPANARPAILAFNGDVYQGMDASNRFSERDFTHAQKSLRILSGLYGLLRPLDLIQPYRLEMGTRLANRAGRDLYAYWGDEITDRLAEAVAASPGSPVLVNLASNEYFSSVRPARLGVPVITPTFLDAPKSAAGRDPGIDEGYRVVAFFAKRARGAMAGWMIEERIRSPRALRGFDRLGYRYDPARSTTANPVFVRPWAPGAAAPVGAAPSGQPRGGSLRPRPGTR